MSVHLLVCNVKQHQVSWAVKNISKLVVHNSVLFSATGEVFMSLQVFFCSS